MSTGTSQDNLCNSGAEGCWNDEREIVRLDKEEFMNGGAFSYNTGFYTLANGVTLLLGWF